MNIARLHQARRRIAHSIKMRMVLVFLLLAAAFTLVFLAGARQAVSEGWRGAARPLLVEYIDRLASDVAPDGRPDLARAQALVERLPLTLSIRGPAINWASYDLEAPAPHRVGPLEEINLLLQRNTADGHILTFGIDGSAVDSGAQWRCYGLSALLLLTLLAWLYVRRLLRPLDIIGDGARRFGAGDFSQPIAARYADQPGELGELAATLNHMGREIHQMLEAKRALLLAISHELRSPLTRARLNAELLPETAEILPQRDALLRDCQVMARLIEDLLESERLVGHVALQREPVDIAALTRGVLQELSVSYAAAEQVRLHSDADLPRLELDSNRIRVLLRNLLDNALRHGASGTQAPEVTLHRSLQGGLEIEVRDHGPGVPEPQRSQLAQAFYRPDSARTRAAGGVGLGLYLSRLVAQAHGGTLEIRAARPGLAVLVALPAPVEEPAGP
ncbi:HAMP domain-containing sensor histidine kinase [Stutzerimonas nitrititolerans]|uniref:HAMP domain-containing sensor histidine kinase n=1 Tax=Stutzerimonas nitrititolerans TaxID=2482751 RepID=UPI0028A71BF4|nr:HAMP domain-containing sensor histidine kinase [Stutzerimonas nitrititolerans]